MIRFRFALGVSLAACLCGGCAADSPAPFDATREVRFIAIRNVSGRAVQSIGVTEDRDPASGPRRMGAIAPVAQNHTYVFARPRNAPQLPAKVRVNFTFSGAPQQTAIIDLREVARQASGDPNEAVVFELRPDGSVAAALDRVQP